MARRKDKRSGGASSCQVGRREHFRNRDLTSSSFPFYLFSLASVIAVLGELVGKSQLLSRIEKEASSPGGREERHGAELVGNLALLLSSSREAMLNPSFCSPSHMQERSSSSSSPSVEPTSRTPPVVRSLSSLSIHVLCSLRFLTLPSSSSNPADDTTGSINVTVHTSQLLYISLASRKVFEGSRSTRLAHFFFLSSSSVFRNQPRRHRLGLLQNLRWSLRQSTFLTSIGT